MLTLHQYTFPKKSLKLINIFLAFYIIIAFFSIIYVRNTLHIMKQILNFQIHFLIKTNIGIDLYIKYI